MISAETTAHAVRFVEWSFNAGAYRSMVWPDPYFVPSLARSTDWADNPRIVAQSADPCFAQRNPRIVTDPWFAHNICMHWFRLLVWFSLMFMLLTVMHTRFTPNEDKTDLNQVTYSTSYLTNKCCTHSINSLWAAAAEHCMFIYCENWAKGVHNYGTCDSITLKDLGWSTLHNKPHDIPAESIDHFSW